MGQPKRKWYYHLRVLFLMLYIPVNNFSVMSGRFSAFPGRTSTQTKSYSRAQQGDSAGGLAQPFDPRSNALATEPLRSAHLLVKSLIHAQLSGGASWLLFGLVLYLRKYFNYVFQQRWLWRD